MAESRATWRYVKSLLDLAIERNVVEEVHRDMLLFSDTVSKNRSLELLLQNPIIKHDKKLQILKLIFAGKVHSLTIAFFDIITRKNREPLLAGIARQFHNAYNDYKGIGKATVTTAVPLDDKLRAEIEKLARAYSDKQQIELIENVEPDLIGGFVLKVGDRQVDASIRSKLRTLEVEFTANPYIREI